MNGHPLNLFSPSLSFSLYFITVEHYSDRRIVDTEHQEPP